MRFYLVLDCVMLNNEIKREVLIEQKKKIDCRAHEGTNSLRSAPTTLFGEKTFREITSELDIFPLDICRSLLKNEARNSTRYSESFPFGRGREGEGTLLGGASRTADR